MEANKAEHPSSYCLFRFQQFNIQHLPFNFPNAIFRFAFLVSHPAPYRFYPLPTSPCPLPTSHSLLPTYDVYPLSPRFKSVQLVRLADSDLQMIALLYADLGPENFLQTRLKTGRHLHH